MKCVLCGCHHDFKCPLIKAYDYFPDGRVKRVEFMTAADFVDAQVQVMDLETMPTVGGKQ